VRKLVSPLVVFAQLFPWRQAKFAVLPVHAGFVYIRSVCRPHGKGLKRVKGCVWETHFRDGASPAISWDRTVFTCHPTPLNAPASVPARQAGSRLTYRGGMEGWVDLGVVAMYRDDSFLNVRTTTKQCTGGWTAQPRKLNEKMSRFSSAHHRVFVSYSTLLLLSRLKYWTVFSIPGMSIRWLNWCGLAESSVLLLLFSWFAFGLIETSEDLETCVLANHLVAQSSSSRCLD